MLPFELVVSSQQRQCQNNIPIWNCLTKMPFFENKLWDHSALETAVRCCFPKATVSSSSVRTHSSWCLLIRWPTGFGTFGVWCLKLTRAKMDMLHADREGAVDQIFWGHRLSTLVLSSGTSTLVTLGFLRRNKYSRQFSGSSPNKSVSIFICLPFSGIGQYSLWMNCIWYCTWLMKSWVQTTPKAWKLNDFFKSPTQFLVFFYPTSSPKPFDRGPSIRHQGPLKRPIAGCLSWSDGSITVPMTPGEEIATPANCSPKSDVKRKHNESICKQFARSSNVVFLFGEVLQ